jgi:GWxTD domain-containing protein
MNLLAASQSLLHFLWQGTLLGLLSAAGLRILPPRLRYVFALSALCLTAALPPATYLVLAPPQHRADLRTPIRVNPPAVESAADFSSPDQPDWARFVFAAWLLGASLMSARMTGAWLVSRRLFLGGDPIAESLEKRARRLAQQLGIARPLRILESQTVTSPCVFGVLKPVILLPAAVVAGLPASQLEAILAHELAHIARQDFLWNCLQRIVESLLFFHPAVWWLSHRIREEREMCCDDAAAKLCNDRILYSRALLAIEELRQPADAFALAAVATNGRSNLRARIARVLGIAEASPAAASGSGPLTLAALSGMAVLALLLATGIQAQEPAAAPNPYRNWLEQDVVYIIAPQEKAAFERLGSDQERQQFIKQFWERRDPTPGTPANEFKVEHYRRIAYASQRYATPAKAGWATDRGRIYIVNGAPDEIEAHPVSKHEEWRYHGGSQFEFRGEDYALVGEKRPAQKEGSNGSR